MSQDDKLNLDDIREARAALEMAEEALRKVIQGHGQGQRALFIFQVGWARGRLSRVTDRIYRAGEASPNPPANDDDAEARGSEG